MECFAAIVDGLFAVSSCCVTVLDTPLLYNVSNVTLKPTAQICPEKEKLHGTTEKTKRYWKQTPS